MKLSEIFVWKYYLQDIYFINTIEIMKNSNQVRSLIPNLETIVKLFIGALFTVIVLAAIGFSGWMFTSVTANENEIEKLNTENSNLINGQMRIESSVENLNNNVLTLNQNITEFIVDTNKEITNNKIETNNSVLTLQGYSEQIVKNQKQIEQIQSDLKNLQDIYLKPILEWVNLQKE